MAMAGMALKVCASINWFFNSFLNRVQTFVL
jgi:hypothetical protein